MEELEKIIFTAVAIMATVGLIEIIVGYYLIHKENEGGNYGTNSQKY